MNDQKFLYNNDTTLRTVIVTVIFCSVFWVITGIAIYKQLLGQRSKLNDEANEVMLGFHERDIRLKLDSINNALIIESLRGELADKEEKILELEIACGNSINDNKRKYELDRSRRMLDDRMIFMHQVDSLHESDEKACPGMQIHNEKQGRCKYRSEEI